MNNTLIRMMRNKLGATAVTAWLALSLVSATHATLIAGGSNIAGGILPTSNETTYTSPDGSLSHLTDGNVGSLWLPIESSGTPPVLATIDLGLVYRITDLNIANSTYGGRITGPYTVTVSTSGAFAGEQTTVVSGSAPAADFILHDIPINANQVGRYLRFSATSIPAGNSNVALQELAVGGVPNRATAALQNVTRVGTTVSAQAFTRTASLTDSSASWSLSLVTPTSGSITQSLGKTVTVAGYNPNYGPVGHIVNGVNDVGANEVLFGGPVQPDLSHGTVTVDLGKRIIVDQLGLLDASYNGVGTDHYLVRVANNLTDFADGGYTTVISSNFAAAGELDIASFSSPIIGRYFQMVALDNYSGLSGLDEMTVIGRDFTTTLLASGSGAIGDSSSFGNITLGSSLASGNNLLTLDVTTPDGLEHQILQQVEFVPEPSTILLMVVGGLVAWWQRRK